MHAAPPPERGSEIPPEHRAALLPVAQRVFWWGHPEDWLDLPIRFAAQVMTFGDWDDTALVARLLGEDLFRRVLENPPPGVFDERSWNFWHLRYKMTVPPLPTRTL